MRKGDWLQTYLGREFWPMDPRSGEVHIEDIAHALSQQCRYAGHTHRFYSVAEHCVHVSEACPPAYAFEGLMHDASEAYLVDIPRPVRKHLSEYAEIEERLERAIADRFDLQYPWPAMVRAIDNRILLDERDQLMRPSPRPKGDSWPDDLEPLGIKIPAWGPAEAKELFIARYNYCRMELVW